MSKDADREGVTSAQEALGVEVVERDDADPRKGDVEGLHLVLEVVHLDAEGVELAAGVLAQASTPTRRRPWASPASRSAKSASWLTSSTSSSRADSASSVRRMPM